jgi:hypothetical protein
MNNSTSILNKINSKLSLSSVYNVSMGAGLLTFNVNPRPVAEIHTGFAFLYSSGAKYINSPDSFPRDDISLGNFKPITPAKKWYLFNGSGAYNSDIIKARITGVDDNNNEVIEDIDVSAITEKPTVNSYKMVNDINMLSASLNTQTIACYPPWPGTGDVSPTQNNSPLMTIVTSSGYGNKSNAFFMCSNKNGLKRKARLTSINSIDVTGSVTEIGLHVFLNNKVNGSGNGVYITKLRLYQIGNSQGITFQDGIVELEAGDLAVFYMESNTTSQINISFTWSYYYTN